MKDGITNFILKYHEEAEQGNVYHQLVLGLCYAHGDCVAQDYVEAVKWFRKAAGQGYAKAQYSLGNCYENGIGVAKDDEEAMALYWQATDQRHAKARYNPGIIWKSGRVSNFIRSSRWRMTSLSQFIH